MPYTPQIVRDPVAAHPPLATRPPCVVLAFRPAPVRPAPPVHITVNIAAPVYTLPCPGEDGEPLAGSPTWRAVCLALLGIAVLLVAATQLASQA